MTKNDIVLDIDLLSADDDLKLATAIDTFLEDQQALGQACSDAISVMVRTTFGPSGQRQKSVVFEDKTLAESFFSFWLDQRDTISAA